MCYVAKQSHHHLSSVGNDLLVSSSSCSASPVKLPKSTLVSTHSAVFSPQVAPLVSASDGSSGAFQMGRYMRDSGDNIRRNSAPDSPDVGHVDPVDSGVLEAFDPLGYSDVRPTKEMDGAEFDVDIDVISKDAASLSLVASSNDVSSLSGGGNPDLQSTGSSASLVDIGIVAGTSAASVVATGSSISVDTLTGCVREPPSLDTVGSCESLQTPVNHDAGARPKTTTSVPFFPPRISISHLGGDGSVQARSSNGKLSSGAAEMVDDVGSVDRSNVGRTTAFHVVQGLSTRSVTARSGVVTGPSLAGAATTSVIEGASGLLSSRVSCSIYQYPNIHL